MQQTLGHTCSGLGRQLHSNSRPCLHRPLSVSPVQHCRTSVRRQRSHAAPLKVQSEAGSERTGEDDVDFEAKLSALKKKSRTAADKKPKEAAPSSSGRRTYDYTDEVEYFESAPHRGDLAINLALGTTLLWLPLTAAAVGRAAFVKYRFTDKRLSVVTSAPWKNEQLDAAYQEVKSVISIGRGVGLWGDMVVTLNNGDKIEMRSLPRFKELEKYILERRDTLTGRGASAAPAKPRAKGF